MHGTPTVSDDKAINRLSDWLFALPKSINFDQELNVFTLIQTDMVKLPFKYVPGGIWKDPLFKMAADVKLLYRSVVNPLLTGLYRFAKDTKSFKLLSKLQ